MTTNQPKRLVRSTDDKWLGGVCGGFAEYTGIDATLIRVLVVVGTVVGFGSLILAYVAAWILMPAVVPTQPPVVQPPAAQPSVSGDETRPEPPTPSA